tara:strand:- start:165 stop:272 length:108 start_codon:yes stop_codon:yes gene_type:complete
MLVGVFEMLVRYQHQVGAIDLMVTGTPVPVDPPSR